MSRTLQRGGQNGSGGFSPTTNDDKWRCPVSVAARVCHWNEDKRTQLVQTEAETRKQRRLWFNCSINRSVAAARRWSFSENQILRRSLNKLMMEANKSDEDVSGRTNKSKSHKALGEVGMATLPATHHHHHHHQQMALCRWHREATGRIMDLWALQHTSPERFVLM